MKKLLTIALNTTLASLLSIFVAPSVLAISNTFSISGTFDDNGLIMGSFTYDFDLGSYTNVNINTTSGTSLNGAFYDDDNDFLTGAGDIGMAIQDLDTDFLLDLVFTPGLTDPTPSFSLNSHEENVLSGDRRELTSGVISAVPFDFSPSFGLLLLITMFGIKQRMSCRKKILEE